MNRKILIAGTALALALPFTALAQDNSAPGAADFQFHCAMCHGPGGKGDGMVGELFAHPPKDLTQLSKENGGKFPFMQVYETLDGTHKFPAHGIGDTRMPVWGSFLSQQGLEVMGLTPRDAKAYAQGRMLGLVYYIQSIQQQ